MSNKKKISIIVCILIIVIIITVILAFSLKNKRYNLIERSKYQLLINIGTTSKENIKNSYSFTYYNDGDKGKVSSSNFPNSVFIIENKLKYLKENTIYSYEVDRSYKNLNETILNISKSKLIKDRKDVSSDSVELDKDIINKILQELYIDEKIDKNCRVDFTVKNNKIESLNIILNDTQKYKNISIMLKYVDLEDSFIIDTSELDEFKDGFIMHYTYEIATENILKIQWYNYHKNSVDWFFCKIMILFIT